MILKKILIVDDEEVVLTFLKEVLQEKGFQVLTALSAKKALELLHDDKECRMVICDIKMPDMNGLELLARLKKERPQLVILMMTAYASWETVTESIQKGAYDYIRKPFSVEDILQSIESAWQRYQLESENTRLKTLFSLFKISRLIEGKIDMQATCRIIFNFLLEHVDAVSSAVVFFDESGKNLENFYCGGKAFDWMNFLSGKPKKNQPKLFTSTAAGHHITQHAQEIEIVEDPAIMGMDLNIFCHPLEHNEVFLGYLLTAKNLQDNLPFSGSDLEFLAIVSQQLAASLSNRRLYLILEKKIAELQAANEKLEETKLHLIQAAKLASAGEMAAGIAHEVGNPIFSIRGTSELMLSRKERYQFSAEVIDFLNIIRKQAARAQDVANSLMTFAQKKDFHAQDLDINAIINNTLALMKVLFFKKNIEVRLDLMEDLSSVRGDKNQLSQVVFNILLNARDALDYQGGIVEIITREAEGHVLVEITDNGHGISPENIPKIFFPFFTTKDVDKGHGLGLSVSYGIMERHEGKITVKSEPGKRTVLTIIFPKVVNRDKGKEGASHENKEEKRP